jgi:hypothetical protein
VFLDNEREGSTVANHLFVDFLEDEAAYAGAERFWADLWQKVLRDTGEEGRWISPWLNTTCVDGTRIRDGDPIFSAIRADGARALRVVQFPPRTPEGEIWTTRRAFDPDGENIQLLEVFCCLSEEVVPQACAALSAWVKEGEARETTNGPPQSDVSTRQL